MNDQHTHTHTNSVIQLRLCIFLASFWIDNSSRCHFSQILSVHAQNVHLISLYGNALQSTCEEHYSQLLINSIRWKKRWRKKLKIIRIIRRSTTWCNISFVKIESKLRTEVNNFHSSGVDPKLYARNGFTFINAMRAEIRKNFRFA